MFENTHEAIIDKDTFARVPELRRNKRRPTRMEKSNVFSEIVLWSDCGEKLYYCTSKNFEASQDHFICSTSRLKGNEVCGSHFIRVVVLAEGVLKHLQLVAFCIYNYEDAFRNAWGAKRDAEARKELSGKWRTLQKSENRIAEFDMLFKRIYVNMVAGHLSEARFQMLSDDYKKEQTELRETITVLTKEISEQEDQVDNIDRFIRTMKKYLYLTELTSTILNKLVKTAYVLVPDKSSGHRVQDVDISYNYIGILLASLLNDLINGTAA